MLRPSRKPGSSWNRDKSLPWAGAWTIAESARLDRELTHWTGNERGATIEIDATRFSRLDSAGAWRLLIRGGRCERGRQVPPISICRSCYHPLLKAWTRSASRTAQVAQSLPAFAGRLLQESAAPPCMPIADHFPCWAIWDADGGNREAIVLPSTLARRRIFHRWQRPHQCAAHCGTAGFLIVLCGRSGRRSTQAFFGGDLQPSTCWAGAAARESATDHRHHRGGPQRPSFTAPIATMGLRKITPCRPWG